MHHTLLGASQIRGVHGPEPVGLGATVGHGLSLSHYDIPDFELPHALLHLPATGVILVFWLRSCYVDAGVVVLCFVSHA